MEQFVTHVLAAFGDSVPHPLSLRPGENCLLGHRIFGDPGGITEEELEMAGVLIWPWPLLAGGQQFVAGLSVDASFQQGGGLFLDVASVVCKSGVVEVFFRWGSTFGEAHVASTLSRFGYQVIDEPSAIRPMLPDFFPGLHI